MPLLLQCPYCKKLLSANAKTCVSKTGKGCEKAIHPDKKIYYAQWRTPEGGTKQKKIGPSKKAAENFLRKVEVDLTENRYIDRKETPKVLIKDFVEESYRPWCETNNRGYYVKKFYIAKIVEVWGNKHLTDLGNEDIELFKTQMKKADCKVMFNRVLSALSHMYTIAIDYGKVDARPFTTAKKTFMEKSRLRYLMPDEVKCLLEACCPHLRPIVITALHTGMRKSEILGLRLGDEIDLQKRRITLTKTKNNEDRSIPINETLSEMLLGATAGKKAGDYLFTWQGKKMADIKNAWASALKSAQIEDFHFHDLRHSFASNLVMHGVDLFAVKELLGHKDIKMTMKYSHLSPEHKTLAVEVLDRVYGKSHKAKIIPLHQSLISHG